MEKKTRCNICEVDVSTHNWSRHLKSKKHQALVKESKHCFMCNTIVPSRLWDEHLKSESHKENVKAFRPNLSRKKLGANKRKFAYNFETEDYLIETTDEALEGCFITLRVL